MKAYYLSTIAIIMLVSSGCREREQTAIQYRYAPPSYDIGIAAGDDTLRFGLNETTYNSIKSVNIFRQDTSIYISLYDGRSESITIYNFLSKKMMGQIRLTTLIPEKSLTKTSVYSKSLDSIFIINKDAILLVTINSVLKGSVLLDKLQEHSMPIFENGRPPVFLNGGIYTGRHARSVGASIPVLQSWKMIYEIDLANGLTGQYYQLPDVYFNNYYGRSFLDYSYCYNDRNRFVFSFPADSNIYETDLKDYNTAFYGKSRFQLTSIKPVPQKELTGKVETRLKSYLLRDSYGEIYFDPVKKRYLRVAKSGLSQSQYDEKMRSKPQRLIIMDQNMKIIGESEMDQNISLSAMLFTPDGRIYARLNPRDEYAINFIRLSYKENRDSVYLSKH